MPRIVPYSDAIETKPRRRPGRQPKTAEPETTAENNYLNFVKIEYGPHFLEI